MPKLNLFSSILQAACTETLHVCLGRESWFCADWPTLNEQRWRSNRRLHLWWRYRAGPASQNH